MKSLPGFRFDFQHLGRARGAVMEEPRNYAPIPTRPPLESDRKAEQRWDDEGGSNPRPAERREP